MDVGVLPVFLKPSRGNLQGKATLDSGVGYQCNCVKTNREGVNQILTQRHKAPRANFREGFTRTSNALG